MSPQHSLGPATLYINGNFSMSGGTFTAYNNLPANLKIYVVTAGGVNISGVSALYADIQAPTSPINLGTITNYYGRLIGKTISYSTGATTAFHVDTSLAAVSGASTPTGGGSGGVSSVK